MNKYKIFKKSKRRRKRRKKDEKEEKTEEEEVGICILDSAGFETPLLENDKINPKQKRNNLQ